jgi:hypothetical protein
MAAVEMAPPIEKQVPKSIFEGCSLDGINSLKNGAVEYLEKIVAKESEEDLYQFFLPKKIWSDLDKTIISVNNLTSGKAQTQAIKTREKSVSTAIADSTQHILKFLYPGQVLILSMLDEIRIENKSLKKQIKTLEEWAKKNDINELLIELKGIKAELAEIRENSTDKDQVNPGNGIRLNQKQNTNAKKPAMIQPKGIDGQPVPGLPKEEIKRKNRKKKNQGKYEEDTNTGPENSEIPESSEGKDRDESQDAPYTDVRTKRKNRGPRAPEVRPRNKREQLASQEIIIHGLKTPEGEKDKMAEAVLIMDTLEELDPKWLGYKKGVIVDMTKDIAFHERIIGHFDGKTKGCQPVKIRFRSQKFCERVKGAAGAAGALNGRKSIHTGKYKIPRIRDSQGAPMKEDDEVIERSKTRPKGIFFRGSITREQKEEFAKIKAEREAFKNDPKFKEISEKRIETIASRVVYGPLRNLDAGKIDEIASANRQRLEDYKKEKEKQREDAYAAKIAKAETEGIDMKDFRIDPLTAANTASRILNPIKSKVPIVEVETESK